MPIDRWMYGEVVVHIYNGILFNHKKEHIWVSSNEVTEPKAYYKGEVSQKEKNKYHILTYYIDYRKMVIMNLFAGQHGENRLVDTVGEGVLLSHSVVSNSVQSNGLQHASLLCPSPSPKACSNSCPLSQWYHTTILSAVVPFISCLQSFPSSGSFLMSQLFALGGQSIRA